MCPAICVSLSSRGACDEGSVPLRPKGPWDALHRKETDCHASLRLARNDRGKSVKGCVGFGAVGTGRFRRETSPNVTKLRKAGSRRNAGSSLFVTIFKIILDKYGKMCGLFANCG